MREHPVSAYGGERRRVLRPGVGTADPPGVDLADRWKGGGMADPRRRGDHRSAGRPARASAEAWAAPYRATVVFCSVVTIITVVIWVLTVR